MEQKKRVLVIGSGGREHAICWKLAQSNHVEEINVLPGSPGIEALAKVKNIEGISINNFKEIASFCKTKNIDLVAVGPEDPLALGLADELESNGISCFGPSKAGAQIEADKSWSKAFMIKHNIPTANYESFTDSYKAKEFINTATYDALVVKASGLAAGKGVVVAADKYEACLAVDEILGDKKFGSAGDVVVIEEKLSGEEISVLAFVDETTVKIMLPAQDHKRLRNNDEGPNTGGMGAYCPCPLIKQTELDLIVKNILQKAVDGLRKDGIKYRGVLYAGMMLTKNGPKTLEFNCRFGDPETQVIMPLLESDLYEIMEACCNNKLAKINLKWKFGLTAVGVVMASKGYPETSFKGCIITGMEQVASQPNKLVFHSGVGKRSDGKFVTNGGRVLINVAIAAALEVAAKEATEACKIIQFEGSQYRSDIAMKAFSKHGLSYRASGVDIDAGEELVKRIIPLARGTNRSGVVGGLGGFGGLFRLNEVEYTDETGLKCKYKDPVLVQGTDGVGTKLKIAEVMGIYDTIGIDLVGMCVNDVLCAGAEPLAFLDYIACGKLEVPKAALIVKGISEACRETFCALLGGETAEMPSMYDTGKYDLAGYCIGVVENDNILPKINEIYPGDLVIGLPSSGVHSNGFSLVIEIMKTINEKFTNIAPFSRNRNSFGKEFLTPTKLYVAPILPVLRQGNIKALAHITGGGLIENIPRVLKDDLLVQLDARKFDIPNVFGWLAAKGNISEFEMLRTFNCGVGMIVIVPANDKSHESLFKYGCKIIGTVQQRDSQQSQVIVNNFKSVLDEISASYRTSVSNGFPPISYKDSGVDISAGNDLVSKIKPLTKSTTISGVIGGLGGFGGLYQLDKKIKDPVLVMGTDGVGTKLKIAQQKSSHNTIGIDLVAMCVNDLLCNGAEPLTFLDYYACGKLDVNVAGDVISGITEGCLQSECALLGGETAEMPGMYQDHVYDIAGFALGVVEYNDVLPKLLSIKEGDVLIALPSSGCHSNGFSLIHKILEHNNLTLNDKAPFSPTGKTFGEELLIPTKIYVSALKTAFNTKCIKSLAHITGGGLLENIPRALPFNLMADLDFSSFNIPPVFAWISSAGRVNDNEMLRTFNCGVGMVLIVSYADSQTVLNSLLGHRPTLIGQIKHRKLTEQQVIVRNFSTRIDLEGKILGMPKKRVAVLISGSGSNLQALIDASRDSSRGLNVEIVVVLSNRPNIFGLERAQKAGIPTAVLNHKDYKSRENFDTVLTVEMEKYNVDIVCLAGFMRILSAQFVKRWKGRLLNIHPSLLPRHKGVNAQQQALLAGDDIAGCTVHFVDEGVDTGAIICQESVPVYKDIDTEATLSQRILKAEHIAFPKALRLLATDQVLLGDDGKCQWL